MFALSFVIKNLSNKFGMGVEKDITDATTWLWLL